MRARCARAWRGSAPRRPSGYSWWLRRTIRGSAAAAALPDGCSLLPPAASNSRRASRAPHLVGRRCACRSRSPARSPRSPRLLGQTPGRARADARRRPRPRLRRGRPGEGDPSPDPLHVRPLRGRLPRPHQRRLRGAPDVAGPGLHGDRLRPRRGHLLPRLLPLRGAEQPDHAPGGRARVDGAHHDLLGRHLGGDDARARRDELLRPPFPPGRRRSGLLPRHDPLPHVLVPGRRAGARGGALHDRDRDGGRGGPLSGKILEQLGGLGGLAGWQWLFVLEGLPAGAFGLAVLVYLTDRPEEADWLAPAERAWLSERMRREHAERAERHRYSVTQALAHGRVWLLALLYFALVCGLYGVSFWIPQIIQGFGGLGDFAVGVVSMVPYLAAAIGMVVVGAHSDRRQERRWHLAGPAFVGAAGLVVSGSVRSPGVSLRALSLRGFGMWGGPGPFWARSATFASGS